jgi:hypothetical protein
MIDTDKPPPSREATQRVDDTPSSEGFHPVKWALAELTNQPVGTSILLEGKDAKRFRHYAHLGKFDRAWEGDNLRVWNIANAAPVSPAPVEQPAPVEPPAPSVDLAAENEALRRRIAELETIPEPTPDPEPETHFADLMLADETLDDAKARLSARLKELRHYLMAPEIRVNEDGSLGLTGEEQAELQDLERRQTLGRWLDA